jgi:hypothetical protein
MEPLNILISGVIVGGAFVAGLFCADRAYNRDRKDWQTGRVKYLAIINRQAEAIDELQLDKNELVDDNRALQAQNWHLARQRFALMSNGQEAEAA